ncbi:MAG: S4 domain-containing protein [Bacteroidales bacterium]
MMETTVRIDKYLWSIRVFKTRSEAADACKSGKVAVNSQEAKSSRDIKQGDKITVRKGAVRYEYLVVCPIDKRQGAALVPQYATNVTPQSELDKLCAPTETVFLKRDRGAGRPTKKERREIVRLLNEMDD